MNLTTKILAGFLAAGVATGAQADTIIVNLATPIVSDESFEALDVNQDGVNDISLYTQTIQSVGVDTGTLSGRSGGFGDPIFDFSDNTDLSAVGYFSYGNVLADSNGDLISLGEGTSVDDGTAAAFDGVWTNVSSSAYDGAEGILPADMDTAYIGVRLELVEYLASDGCNGCEVANGRVPALLGYIYGWVELERGSLITSLFGYGSDLNLAAVTPVSPGDPNVVPLPAGLPLLLAGLGAFGLMGRRRRAQA